MSDETEDDEEFDPGEAERQIDGFIAAADDLPGPAVAELADRVAEVIRATSAQLDGVLAGVAHNKVLAAQLLLSQRARQLTPDDPGQWQLFAGSTLLSGRITGAAAPAPE